MKEKIKNVIGNILVAIQPNKAAELAKNGMTIEWYHKLTLKERLMRNAILKKAESSGDFKTLAEFHRNYWVNKGVDFFSSTDDSFEQVFLPHCSFIFDLLQEQLLKESNDFDTIVEIGTGNGNVLAYLESKFPKISRFIGIDLSEDQIKINKNRFEKEGNLEFVSADAFDWVASYGEPNMIFITSLGVLEYFTEERLTAFFALLYGLGNIIFVAIEPNGVDHNFSINPNSQPYGHERSFSHNYPVLFENAGFKLWHESKKQLGDHDFFSCFIGAKN